MASRYSRRDESLSWSLLCLVLFASECFAIKGGPPYPTGTSIIGTYAVVVQPAFDPTDPFSANSLGLFTLGVSSTGTFIMFTRGRVFSGTIQGVADPNKTTLSAPTSSSSGANPWPRHRTPCGGVQGVNSRIPPVLQRWIIVGTASGCR